MTNEGCTKAGSSCDYAGDSEEFVCFESGNTEAEGANCDQVDGPWCQPMLTCIAVGDGDGGVLSSTCGKWCCADSDCTAPKTCVKYDAVAATQNFGSLGRCM